MVKITLPDGNEKKFEKEVNALEIAKSISEGLSRVAVACKINGTFEDLTTTISEDSTVEIITTKDKESLEILRHTVAHVFAQALLRVFPKAKITIGPTTENGFYYDVDYDDLSEEHFPLIEEEMSKIIKEDLVIEKNHKSYEEAKKFFFDNHYKQEIIDAISSGSLSEEEMQEGSIDGDKFSFYKQGEFEDLCRGPHLPRTGMIKAFKLEKITRAYWRGNSENKQLNRVYGNAFWKKSDMDEYYEMLEEAKKRDHRVLGKQMKLFSFHDEGPGFPFWHPKGVLLFTQLQNLCRELNNKHGYNEIMTPVILNKQLWKTSGHWNHFNENMYFTNIDEKEFAIKPMNCPGGLLIYNSEYHSYRDLPLRNAEFGYVHRHELSGALSGLFRVRAFTQDDAHVFCTEEQVEEEIISMIEYAIEIYSIFNFTELEWFIATRPESSIGTDEAWDLATNALIKALESKNLSYKIKDGEGAFYGPKIEINMKDAISRRWQCGTIQVDFSMPKKFEAFYENSDGKRETPVMIHRAILGSLERFTGIFIENFAGKFPLWISPTQVQVINVADRHLEYCESIVKKLKSEGFRVETSFDAQTVSNKIRLARDENKPNYMLILGDKDESDKTVSVRTRKFVDGKNEEFTTTIDKFIEMLKEERDKREIKD